VNPSRRVLPPPHRMHAIVHPFPTHLRPAVYRPPSCNKTPSLPSSPDSDGPHAGHRRPGPTAGAPANVDNSTSLRQKARTGSRLRIDVLRWSPPESVRRGRSPGSPPLRAPGRPHTRALIHAHSSPVLRAGRPHSRTAAWMASWAPERRERVGTRVPGSSRPRERWPGLNSLERAVRAPGPGSRRATRPGRSCRRCRG